MNERKRAKKIGLLIGRSVYFISKHGVNINIFLFMMVGLVFFIQMTPEAMKFILGDRLYHAEAVQWQEIHQEEVEEMRNLIIVMFYEIGVVTYMLFMGMREMNQYRVWCRWSQRPRAEKREIICHRIWLVMAAVMVGSLIYFSENLYSSLLRQCSICFVIVSLLNIVGDIGKYSWKEGKIIKRSGLRYLEHEDDREW